MKKKLTMKHIFIPVAIVVLILAIVAVIPIFFNGVFGQLISLFIAANFIIEFVINLLLSPSIYYIVNLFKKRKKNYERIQGHCRRQQIL